MGIDPSWTYPEPPKRPVRKDDPVIGVALGILLGVVMLFWGIAFAMGHRGFDMWLFLFIALAMLAGVIYGSRADRELAMKKAELVAKGVHCWGRILGVAPKGGSASMNGRHASTVRITVEAFAAPAPTGVQPHAVGTRVADKVDIEAEVSQLQFALMIPGHFCAFLLHPTDHRHTRLDGFVTAQGLVVAKI
ncbi:hypothetical protein [Myxococcus landrumensis]|nr:hypothetical protein [Myxococcus landrumus]